jgi:hypothetical protein
MDTEDEKNRRISKNNWFDPRNLYEGGYPRGIISGFSGFEKVRKALLSMIDEIAPKTALEIGPGDAPVLGAVPRRFYMDIALPFLKDLDGFRIQADLRNLPLRGHFDLVVLSDVITHIPPRERKRCLLEILGLGERVLIFNGEIIGSGDTRLDQFPGIDGSAVRTDWIVQTLKEAGRGIWQKGFIFLSRRGFLHKTIILAEK